MKSSIKKILILYLLFAAARASAEEISAAFMREHESGGIIYTDKKTSVQRSMVTFSTERILRDGRVTYRYAARGEGDYDEYKNSVWDIEAVMEERDGLLRPIYSLDRFKDKDGRAVIGHEKRFDYDKQKIYYTVHDPGGKITKKITFPMKGITVDSATLTDFLKTFAARRDEKTHKVFYLISDKAELFRITVKDLGIETLELPEGKIRAIKLRLIPNLGLLTGVANSLVPPTFVWYKEQEPHDWLQYEGLETGMGSAHITARFSPE
ncbi:MAG: hypothetical protein WC569_00340 [Candidatus Omnitrophota bacterium]